MDAKKVEKEALFKDLYELDESDDASVDVHGPHNPLTCEREIDTSLQRSSNTLGQDRKTSKEQSATSTCCNRSASLPYAPPRHPSMLPANGQNQEVIIPYYQTASHKSNQEDTTVLATKKKRKRGQPQVLLPSPKQIFQGLVFYFFPNNDIAPPRKFRIKKALERGATWVKEWQSNITHIIVDKAFKYTDLVSFLGISSLPPNVALVNDRYPADCIQYEMMVNPLQRLYDVDGWQKTEPAMPVSKESLSYQQPVQSKASGSIYNISCTDNIRQDAKGSLQTLARAHGHFHEAPRPDSEKLSDDCPDALDKAIVETLTLKNLPLDVNDDLNIAHTSSFHISGEDHNSEEEPSKRNKHPALVNSWQDKFSCMQEHTGTLSKENPNAKTIEILKRMADYYDRTKDHWRTTSYRRAISALSKQTKKISTKEEAFAIPSIGERLAEKIEEIVWTDRLRRLENTNFDSSDEALQLFLRIYGVGYVQASHWIGQGFRTLNDLMTKAKLTKNQKIGIEHLEDFSARIPRNEVERHGTIVRKAVFDEDPEVEVTIGGSYRRGAADSGDVDFIFTKPDCSILALRTIILGTVLPQLFDSGYLQCGLAVTDKEDGSKWHGAACLPGTTIWRRVDFLLVTYEEIGAALIYFTGNDIFNRSMRLLASKKGLRLNQHGLWKNVLRGKNRQRITQGSLVEGKGELKIFEHLEVPWRPPEHRNC